MIFIFTGSFYIIFLSKPQITEDEAIEKALTYQYKSLERYFDGRDKVLGVEKDLFGNYIIHLCDLNIECTCRSNEGYWIKVSRDGNSVFTQKQNLCLFG